MRIFYITLFLIIFLLLSAGCASKGLLTDLHHPDTLRVDNALESMENKNPHFLVYADNQAGRLAIEKFYRSENWKNWKQLLFPFYQTYLIGNGLIGGINFLRHKPDYGYETRIMMRDAMYNRAKENKVDFIFNIGDICYADGRYPEHWEGFLRENKWEHPLLDDIPYLTAIGNHERANEEIYGLSNYNAVFDYPRHYKVDFPDAVLIVLDSNIIVDQDKLIDDSKQDEYFEKIFVSSTSSRKSWLEQQLTDAGDKFILIAMHHPPATFGHHYADWYQSKNGNKLIEKRKQLINLFTKYEVDVVLSGHEHYYQHNIVRYGNNKKIHFIVSSGGGTPIRKAPGQKTKENKMSSYLDSGINLESIKQVEKYHLTDVSISSDKLKIDTYIVTDKKSSDLKLFDRLVITRN